MKVALDRIDHKFHFETKGKTGVPVFIDNSTGAQVKGASPMNARMSTDAIYID